MTLANATRDVGLGYAKRDRADHMMREAQGDDFSCLFLRALLLGSGAGGPAILFVPALVLLLLLVCFCLSVFTIQQACMIMCDM